MEEGSTQTIVAVPPAFTLKPYNSVFPYMFIPPPWLLSLQHTPGWMLESKSVNGPFMGTPGFPVPFHLTQMAKIPGDFHSHMLGCSSSQHWYSGLESPVWGWNSSLSGVSYAAEIPWCECCIMHFKLLHTHCCFVWQQCKRMPAGHLAYSPIWVSMKWNMTLDLGTHSCSPEAR